MMRWQLHLLLPIVAVMVLFAALSVYALSHSTRHYRFKLVLIPAAIAAAVLSFSLVGSRMGYGFPAGLPASFEYLAHTVIMENNTKTWIDVLVISRKPLENAARLHRVPWSKQLEQLLKQGREMQRGGGRIEMDRGSAHGDEYPEWVPKRVLPQDSSPKEPLPPPAEGRPNPNYTT